MTEMERSNGIPMEIFRLTKTMLNHLHVHLDLAGFLPERHCEFGKDIGIDMIFTAKDKLSNDKEWCN